MEILATSYLSLGSDLGKRLENLQTAVNKINSLIGKVTDISNIFETAPVGFKSNTMFLNICVKVVTKLSPQELLKSTQVIEQLIGRKEKSTKSEYASRFIDIDIILFDEKIIQTSSLEIPHPLFRKRNFVLFPLEEVAKNNIDPKTGLTIFQLKNNCIDKSSISISSLSISI